MRHRKCGVKLNRSSSHRRAMFRNMVTSLFKHDRIKTTDAKAKELRRWADQIVTLAKRGDLHARRMAMSIVREKDVVHKIFEEASDRFGSIHGGYTRIIKIGRRSGDAAAMTLVELVSSDVARPAKPKKSKTKTEDQPASGGIEATGAVAAVADRTQPVADDGPAEAAADDASSIDSEPDDSETEDSTEKASKATADPGETEK